MDHVVGGPKNGSEPRRGDGALQLPKNLSVFSHLTTSTKRLLLRSSKTTTSCKTYNTIRQQNTIQRRASAKPFRKKFQSRDATPVGSANSSVDLHQRCPIHCVNRFVEERIGWAIQFGRETVRVRLNTAAWSNDAYQGQNTGRWVPKRRLGRIEKTRV